MKTRHLALLALFSACGDERQPIPPPTGQRPAITSFVSDKPAVASGQTVELSYIVTDADEVTLAVDGGATFATKTEAQATVTSPAITQPTTFVLTARNDVGSVTGRVTVTIASGAPQILSFSADPPAVAPNGSTTLRWTLAGVEQLRLLRGADEISMTSTPGNMGQEVVTLAATAEFTLIATANGQEDRETLTVNVGTPVAIEAFRVSPQSFTGATADVSVFWRARSATSLTLTANGNPVSNFPAGTDTGTITVTVNDTTRFVLTALGVGGPLSEERVVGRATSEAEPNETYQTANPLTGPAVVGNVGAGDVDVFAIMVPAGGSVDAEVTDGMGACAFDSLVELLDANGTEVASDDDNGVGNCSHLTPSLGASDLPAGPYYLVVRGFDAAAMGAYTLLVRVSGPMCGNGLIETRGPSVEQCDDGNGAALDGCSASCAFEIASTVTGPPAEATHDGALGMGHVTRISVVLNAPGYVYAETGVPTIGSCAMPADTILTLTSSSGARVSGSDDISGTNRCSRIDPTEGGSAATLLRPGTYMLTTRSLDGSAIAQLQTLVRIVAPGCGNRVVEAPEQCDDGNTMGGDGCSAQCRFDGAFVGEVEPNDMSAQATALGDVRTATVTAAGAIGAMGADVDFYSFEIVGQTSALTVRIYAMPGDYSSCNGDTVLELLDSSGNTVTTNDDGSESVCSEISPLTTEAEAEMLAPGRYYLRVSEYDENDEISGYLMDVRIR